MSEGAEREMTLGEWCERLPEFHLVNRQLEQLQATNKELLEAMIAVQDDLRMRGSFDDNYQTRVVNVSHSVWLRFCEAITNAKQREKL